MARRQGTAAVVAAAGLALGAPWVGAGLAGQTDTPLLAAAARTTATTGAPGWLPPLTGALRVVRPFAPPTSRYGAGHRGVDLASAPGAAVLSAGPGTVVFAGELAGRGVVSVQHGDGLRTTYEPVDAPLVRRGDRVLPGEPLGLLSPGHPGCAGAACLHWGLRRGTGAAAVYLDPMLLLGLGPIRLLPLAGLSTGGTVGPAGLVVRAGVAVPGPGSGGRAARAPT